MNKLEPRIRFEGFSDEWEKDKVENIGEFYSGGTPLSSKKEYYQGTIPFIRSGEIHDLETKLYISQSAIENSSAKFVKKGDILFALYGATSGEVSISKINGAINQAILAIIPSNNYDNKFIEIYLRKNKNKINNKYLQGGQKNLSASIIKSL